MCVGEHGSREKTFGMTLQYDYHHLPLQPDISRSVKAVYFANQCIEMIFQDNKACI